MHESDAYYEEILYPLQNGVLSTLAACEAPFYAQEQSCGTTATVLKMWRTYCADAARVSATSTDRLCSRACCRRCRGSVS